MSVLSVRRRARTLMCVAATGVLATGAVVAPAAADPVAPTPAAGSLTGRTVFLDPGHQGGTDGHSLTKQVPDGRGGTKDCQTTGATAVTGMTEHTINWNVAQLVKAGLEREGAKVILSRNNDTGWGGCVDERAAAASASGADLAVSLHADSTSAGADAGKSGFHLIVPALPVPDATVTSVQGGRGRQATEAMRDALKRANFTPVNYGGIADGVQTRSDIAGANLTKVPLVFLEMGNLSNPAEARELSSAAGDTRYAMAVTNGITTYLSTAPAPNPVPLAPGEGTGADTGASDMSDLAALSAVGPLIEQLSKASSLAEAESILAAQGSDVSSQVLKAMLAVVYAVFGGKLPI
ncbi:N-acetylmuramoyl-L-alanine amidase [Gordonia sp. (in: high G+C Gram-positive bacteria)]|uniref:N-acetylmuramoyl-L-alanine amidase n=1 Tax=Gordonia sp. (in: high G+C Gram-positive bacteria) TaxID=84139 RepID=UPI00260E618E|nr:N-acetylmuramoyl-L-alanine amidase [Gordonia sp. (in: high G+C Gram-positive bacteria)]